MIFTAFFSVGEQVVILFILIAVGFIASKAKLITKETIPGINNFILYVVTVSVIIDSFHREFNQDMLASLGIALLAALATHVLNAAIATLLVHDKSAAREAVLRFCTVFSNCGFMALPLQAALLGPDGVFYGAAFVAVFNIFTWTYGIFIMGGKEAGFSTRNLFLNPGVISVLIGLFFFLTPFSLPTVILSPLRHLAALNTPLPMIVIGYYLSCITSLKILRDGKLWLVILLRLIALPLTEIMLCYVVGIKDTLLASIAISTCAPAAANALIFAGKFNRDTGLAATLVSVSTLASIITMPFLVSLAMVMQ